MYEKYTDLLNLVFEMQGSIDGVTYEEIQEQYQVSRRTAERMVVAIRDSFMDIESISNRPKKWRIRKHLSTPNFTYQQLSILQTASNMFRANNMPTYAQEMDALLFNLRANMGHKELRNVEADIDALKDAEAFVFRPGPREQIESSVIQNLREAILGCHKVNFDYTNRKNKTRNITVYPYGFLHVTKHYLVAFNPNKKTNDYRTYIVKKIENLKVLEHEYFEMDEEFSFENYLKHCFRVFSEKPYKIHWRFSKEVANEVKDWEFHHSQTTHESRDGKLDVKFRAGGLQEMAWHLVTWGSHVEVIKPKALIKTLRKTVKAVNLPEEKAPKSDKEADPVEKAADQAEEVSSQPVEEASQTKQESVQPNETAHQTEKDLNQSEDDVAQSEENVDQPEGSED